uniref:Uncharacterized protein n=1 Tax=Trichogramma kaykai TaxID=54128 RepID=A0ABD2X7E9_9HYME
MDNITLCVVLLTLIQFSRPRRAPIVKLTGEYPSILQNYKSSTKKEVRYIHKQLFSKLISYGFLSSYVIISYINNRKELISTDFIEIFETIFNSKW